MKLLSIEKEITKVKVELSPLELRVLEAILARTSHDTFAKLCEDADLVMEEREKDIIYHMYNDILKVTENLPEEV